VRGGGGGGVGGGAGGAGAAVGGAVGAEVASSSSPQATMKRKVRSKAPKRAYMDRFDMGLKCGMGDYLLITPSGAWVVTKVGGWVDGREFGCDCQTRGGTG